VGHRLRLMEALVPQYQDTTRMAVALPTSPAMSDEGIHVSPKVTR